jgi:radical SAM protein with 4Fe4S-binding SPASM domain
MNVVRDSNGRVIEFLGGPQKKVKGFKYRFNKFVVKTDYSEDEFIWYNTFTGALVSIKDYEINNIWDEDEKCSYVDFLIRNYFLVPEQFDEESIMYAYRKRHVVPIDANYLTRLNHFTIMTTTKCNARCFYCYQMHSKHKRHMTEETAHEVAKYIIDTTQEGQLVTLGWFGGEPLFNHKVMDIITTKVASSGRQVSSSIITNGYLFDEKLCKKAVRDWSITNAQITLDGTEDVYNKAKNFIYKDGRSPFKVVIENIHTMLKNGISVSVRMNVDLHNVDNLTELIKFLAEEFKNEPDFSAYIHELFDDTRTIEHDEQLFANMQKVDDLLVESNLRTPGYNIPDDIKCIHCMVDDGRSVVITPDGKIGLCEHYENEHYISNLETPYDIDFAEVDAWREMSEYTEICSDCPIRPTCLKCKLCPDHKICSAPEKEYVLNKLYGDMRVFYDNWVRIQQGGCGNGCNCGNN